jgi:hypothetical protein
MGRVVQKAKGTSGTGKGKGKGRADAGLEDIPGGWGNMGAGKAKGKVGKDIALEESNIVARWNAGKYHASFGK